MPVVDAYGESRAAEVMEDTWGHLRATPNKRHHGTIIFAESAFDNQNAVILSCDFGESAGYGPWFYEQVHEWLFEQETEPGRIYTWTGWYRTTKTDRYEFRGSIEERSL